MFHEMFHGASRTYQGFCGLALCVVLASCDTTDTLTSAGVAQGGSAGSDGVGGAEGSVAGSGGAGGSAVSLAGASGNNDGNLFGPDGPPTIECGGIECAYGDTCCAVGEVCGYAPPTAYVTLSCVSHAFLDGQLDSDCPASGELRRYAASHRFPGCRQAADGQCGYWITADQTEQGEDVGDWVPNLGCVPPDWVVGGVVDGGVSDASDATNDAGCDVGCTPLFVDGIGNCANDELEWLCDGSYDAQLFNANCETVPVNSIRYCCPESFLAQCQ